MKGHSDVFNQTIIVIDGRRSAHTAHLLITTKPNLSLKSTQGFYRKFIIYSLDANLWDSIWDCKRGGCRFDYHIGERI